MKILLNATGNVLYLFTDQNEWYTRYPSCGGHSQSPVSLPSTGMRRMEEARPLTFANFDAMPESMVVENNGKTRR